MFTHVVQFAFNSSCTLCHWPLYGWVCQHCPNILVKLGFCCV